METDYTSVKVPRALTIRFDDVKNDLWQGYRTFSEFCVEIVRKEVANLEEQVAQRKSGSVGK